MSWKPISRQQKNTMPGLDPFEANLVVADAARGRGAICLAISPALKQLGVRNRCRLYEIPSWIKYTIAKPRMKKYMEYSTAIYRNYLDYQSGGYSRIFH